MKKAIILILIILIHSNASADSAGGDYPRGGTPIISSFPELKIISEKITIKNKKVEAEYWILNNTNIDISTEITFPFYLYQLERIDHMDADENKYIMGLAGEVFKDMQLFVSGFSFKPKVEINSKKKLFEVSQKVQFKNSSQTKIKISYPLNYGWRLSAYDDFDTDEKTFWFMCETAKFLKYPIETFEFKFCDEEVNSFKEYLDDFTEEVPEKSLEAFPKGYSITKKDSCIEWKQSHWQPKDDSMNIRLYFTKTNVNN